jgi:hypothetical protein
MATLTLPVVAVYLKARAINLAEKETPYLPVIPVVVGVAALAIMFIMGYVREAARAPYLVFNQLAAADDVFEKAGSVSTLPMPASLAVPLILFGMVLFAVLGWIIVGTTHGTAVETVDTAHGPRVAA